VRNPLQGKGRLLADTSIYTGSNILNKLIPFLLMPVLTRYLSTEEYGYIATFVSLNALLMVFVGFNSHIAIGRDYFDLDQARMAAYIGSVLVLCVAGFAVLTLVLWIFVGPLSEQLELPRPWIVAVPLVTLFNVICLAYQTLVRMQRAPMRFALFSNAQSLVNIVLSLLFVVGLGWGWQGRFQGWLWSVVSFGIVALVVMRREGYLAGTYDKDLARRALAFGLPLIPHNASMWALSLSDRFFLASMVGASETGLYSVASSLGSIIFLLADAFNKAWTPELYSRLKKNDPVQRRKLVLFTYAYFAGILLAAGAVSWIAPFFLGYLVDESFYPAAKYVWPVAFGFAFSGMYRMVVGYLFYVRRTGVLSYITGASGVLNLILNYLLIGRYGAMGAAYATFFSYLFSFIVTWIVTQRIYPMPWLLREE
jgi:O-antigen/teichoic acid export membrane protein